MQLVAATVVLLLLFSFAYTPLSNENTVTIDTTKLDQLQFSAPGCTINIQPISELDTSSDMTLNLLLPNLNPLNGQHRYLNTDSQNGIYNVEMSEIAKAMLAAESKTSQDMFKSAKSDGNVPSMSINSSAVNNNNGGSQDIYNLTYHSKSCIFTLYIKGGVCKIPIVLKQENIVLNVKNIRLSNLTIDITGERSNSLIHMDNV